jgi:hypothetical protein
MALCSTCGNEYAHTFMVKMDGQAHHFDCFECAIQKLAPRCRRCGIPVIGHGVEKGSSIYCCAHCARHQGIEELSDHA